MKKTRFIVPLLIISTIIFWCNSNTPSNNSTDYTKSENIILWWYLYRNLNLENEADKKEYKQLQTDKTLILEYQTKTSHAINKFIDTIHQDLLDSCKMYWTNHDTTTGSFYERDVCVDSYISNLHQKLKSELINPQKKYSDKDPVLLSYYQDLQGDHPFVRYFVDLYDYILKKWWDLGKIPEYPIIWPLTPNTEWWYRNDEESAQDLAVKNWTWFYTYWIWNITETDYWSHISSISSWIVVNGHMLERIKKEYWYHFPYWSMEIEYGSAPMYWPFVLYYEEESRNYIYQIIGAGAWSWEFILLVRVLIDWLWIPLGQCGHNWYVLFPNYPQLFGECNEWTNNNPLTIFTQELDLYDWNSILQMADNFAFFLKALESTRVLSK